MLCNLSKLKGRKLKNSQGLTILEAVIYVAILIVFFVIVVQTMLVSATAFGKSRVKRALAAEGHIVMERVLHEIRFAGSIDDGTSVFGTHPGVLKLNTRKSASDDTLTTRMFDLSDDTMRITEGGGTSAALSGSISITNLVFYKISGSPPAVRVEMTAENSFKTLGDSRKFYGTAVLRGGY